jgi:hypothetical protein
MKKTAQILLLLGTAIGAGCVTRYQACYPSRDERTVFAITALYEGTRLLTATNGVYRYVLVPETEVIQSAETLLLHHAQSEKATVRGAAVCRLAHFGTRSALIRALEVAHAEADPETRAGIWCAIAELLQRPLTWPLPQVKPIAGSAEANTDTNLVQIFSSTDLRLVISCWHKPADFILPPDIPAETIESEIIKQYATDAGTWSVEVVDRIPFVPFSARHRTLTLTVRQSIADALQWSARDNERTMAAFREFSRDENEAISGPARQVVEALSHSGWPGLDESREARTPR